MPVSMQIKNGYPVYRALLYYQGEKVLDKWRSSEEEANRLYSEALAKLPEEERRKRIERAKPMKRRKANPAIANDWFRRALV